MTGQIRWAVYGGFAMLAGIGLLLAAKRRRKS
jgi:LPXTG-motif cell wall-anchored protein